MPSWINKWIIEQYEDKSFAVFSVNSKDHCGLKTIEETIKTLEKELRK